MTCLRDEIAYNIAFAKSYFSEQSILKGMAIIAIGSERRVYGYDVRSVDEEKVLSEIIKGEVRKWHATTLITLSIGERLDKKTSERQDCIVVVIVTKITTARVVIPFVKIAETVVFGEETIIKDKTAKEKIWHDLFCVQNKES